MPMCEVRYFEKGGRGRLRILIYTCLSALKMKNVSGLPTSQRKKSLCTVIYYCSTYNRRSIHQSVTFHSVSAFSVTTYHNHLICTCIYVLYICSIAIRNCETSSSLPNDILTIHWIYGTVLFSRALFSIEVVLKYLKSRKNEH